MASYEQYAIVYLFSITPLCTSCELYAILYLM